MNRVLDVVEVSFQVLLDLAIHHGVPVSKRIVTDIDEVNHRFKEHGVGYQFTNGVVIRIDSEYLHSEVVKLALDILQQEQFSGARQEYLSAHKHYRNGEIEETLNECLKALESLMKAICDKRKWNYAPNATAKSLIDVCFKISLFRSFGRLITRH